MADVALKFFATISPAGERCRHISYRPDVGLTQEETGRGRRRSPHVQSCATEPRRARNMQTCAIIAVFG
jgi:hypothetical protein